MHVKDGVPAMAFLALGMIGLVAMRRLPIGTIREPGTAFFPVVLSGLLILLSLLLLRKSIKRKAVKPVQKRMADWKRLILAALGIVVYAKLLETVGYLPCTILILILLAKLGKCYWKTTLVVSILFAFFSYAVFRWYLHSPLPQGVVPF